MITSNGVFEYYAEGYIWASYSLKCNAAEMIYNFTGWLCFIEVGVPCSLNSLSVPSKYHCRYFCSACKGRCIILNFPWQFSCHFDVGTKFLSNLTFRWAMQYRQLPRDGLSLCPNGSGSAILVESGALANVCRTVHTYLPLWVWRCRAVVGLWPLCL